MDFFSTLDRPARATGLVPDGEEAVVLNSEQELEQGNGTRTSQARISAALAAANAGLQSTLASPVHFPGEDGGRSLAEMAQRDLDAALQLLADRAQYITGANGAAIALRRSGKKDMLCRASTGSNVPELGALLSTEFGLSGESVRTRQPLRCDDAERDARVNRDVCRQMGIASVVVMPVVNDDEVLGVFELFSAQVNAFGERDLSALQRLSQMVETAVRLAHASESVSERIMSAEGPAAESAAPVAVNGDVEDDDILEVEDTVVEVEGAEGAGIGTSGAEALAEEESLIAALEALRQPGAEVSAGGPSAEHPSEDSPPADHLSANPASPTYVSATYEGALELPTTPQKEPVPAAPLAVPVPPSVTTPPTVVAPPTTAAPKKPLFWSAALQMSAEAQKPAESDQSHVPPMLRKLRKCEVCGFPVSSERSLCVECEEKKWRGQLRRPIADLPKSASSLATPKTKTAPIDAPKPSSPVQNVMSGEPVVAAAQSAPVARLMAAAAMSAAAAAPAPVPSPAPISTPAAEAVSVTAAPSTQAASDARAKESSDASAPPVAIAQLPVQPTAPGPVAVQIPVQVASEAASADFVLSAGLAPSQSWFAANKYIVGAILVVAAVVVAILLLR